MSRTVIPYHWVMLDLDVDAKRIDSKTVECEVRVEGTHNKREAELKAVELADAAIASRGFATSNVTGYERLPGAPRIRVVMNAKKRRGSRAA